MEVVEIVTSVFFFYIAKSHTRSYYTLQIHFIWNFKCQKHSKSVSRTLQMDEKVNWMFKITLHLSSARHSRLKLFHANVNSLIDPNMGACWGGRWVYWHNSLKSACSGNDEISTLAQWGFLLIKVLNTGRKKSFLGEKRDEALYFRTRHSAALR